MLNITSDEQIFGQRHQNVVVHFTASDSLSGLASLTPDVTISTEGIGKSATGTATDKADNSNSTTVSGINIDRARPTISLTGSSTANILLNSAYADAGATISDNLTPSASIVKTIQSNVNTSVPGKYAVTYTATDLAGNTDSGEDCKCWLQVWRIPITAAKADVQPRLVGSC